MSKQVSALVNRRQGYAVKLQNIKKQCELGSQLSASQLDLLLERISALVQDNEQNFEQLTLLQEDDDDDKDDTVKDYAALDEDLFILKATVMELMKKLPVPTSSTQSVAPRPMDVRLPKLDIPKFGGNFSDWESFKDLFESIIKNNEMLSGAQKLQFLKFGVNGEAAKQIQNFQITNGNFEEAWATLVNRYDNKREIVNSHLSRLFSQPCLQGESASGLRELIDCTNESVRALNVLNEPTNEWSTILVYLLCGKLDSESRRQWELSLVGNELPKFEKIIEFLEQRARALAVSGPVKVNHPSTHKSSGGKHTAVHHGSISKPKCGFCSGDHWTNKCGDLLKLVVPERIEWAKKNNSCFNCLSTGHSAHTCEKGCCRVCKKKHHTLLHLENSSGPERPVDVHRRALLVHHGEVLPQVLLATAMVNVMDANGHLQPCRALLDQGSEANVISETCMERLGLRRRKLDVNITGLASSSVEKARGVVKLDVFSSVSNFSFTIQALILTKVTGDLPKYACSSTKWSHLNKLTLADPLFHQPGKVDILIGAQHVAFLMKGGRQCGKKGTPIAQESELGWILSGPIDVGLVKEIGVHHARCELDWTLRKFWELEEIQMSDESTAHLSPEDRACVEHFAATHQRDESGRFIVELPFRPNSPKLGDSFEMAKRRWLAVERRISRDPKLYDQYQACLQEYLDLGHMELVPDDELDNPNVYYIPHHEVIKESSSTTKLRVVFDASAKTTNGVSLNDILMTGPKLQDDLIPQFIQFLTHFIALIADIAKMYRQFLMAKKHRDFQRIVWRSHPGGPLRVYRLVTVTFGVRCAPFQAISSVQQLARDEQESFPLAAPAILKNLYVDNLVTGRKIRPDALEFQSQVIQMMKKGGMVMRQWSSSDWALLDSLPMNLRETQVPFSMDLDDTVKTLGVQWNPSLDQFSFKVNLGPLKEKLTKRILLSDIAKLFDPLGWLAPVTIRAKLLMQSLWKLTLGWDEQLPLGIQNEWRMYRDNLPQLESIIIPRCITSPTAQRYELHGFSDASELAYAAVTYLRVLDLDGTWRVKLITSKTRVAPIRQISIPRLELCGALLVAQLMKIVNKALNLKIESFHAWTDSTVVLHWLDDHPGRWKTFVANRVAEIQSLLPFPHWHHVAGKDNPADVASRGISPSEIEQHPLWWHGPQWLCQNLKLVDPSPAGPGELSTIKLEEKSQEVTVCHAQANGDENPLFSLYSSLTRLIRISAWGLRFFHNCRPSKGEKRRGDLTIMETTQALLSLTRAVQHATFSVEIQQLRQNGVVNPKSPMASLNPFLKDNLVRVGGRLRAAVIPESQKFPLLLPKKNKLTELIINYYHHVNLHAGPQLLTAALRQNYWILGIRDVVRRYCKACVTCQRLKTTVGKQMMADLPSSRVTPGRAFESTGVDYAGPISILNHRGKWSRSTKGYIVLFICFTTRAIHLELANDLTTGTFVATLKRFISRRGRPAHVYSDNAGNFSRADKDLRTALRAALSTQRDGMVTRYLTNEKINWHFSPPASPHFGGLWEAGIKSVKYHLKRVTMNAKLTYVEMMTLLTQIEACLNSRPLTELSSDPNDLTALTPGHFLIGAPLNSIPEPDLTHRDMTQLSRWQLTSRLLQQFWKRWAAEYLTRLQQRPKWVGPQRNFKIGDIVLIKQEFLAPLQWLMGRVVEIHPGVDGRVRVVTLKTANGQLKRPISKLSLLPIDSK